ncbi:MAG: type VI secretion system lipoprotein TssJ [Acetobacteraceae bacterium]|nr:type VI secretion system lipoprotein TssJ [Acetobacteraceae bacterium]
MRRRSVLLGLPLAACGGPPPPPAPPPAPPEIDLAIQAGADQNPDADGHATPVSVRVFQLTGTGRFEGADVFALSDHPESALGDELAGVEQVIVQPGETRTLTAAPKPGVQFVGTAVLFRDIDRAQWRATAPIAPHGPTRLALRIAGLTATLAPA